MFAIHLKYFVCLETKFSTDSKEVSSAVDRQTLNISVQLKLPRQVALWLTLISCSVLVLGFHNLRVLGTLSFAFNQ